MEIGINIRNWGPTATREFLTESAKIVDNSSLDALWFNDHIGFPPKIKNNVFGVPKEMGSIIDPLGLACYFASVTKRVRFGTGVLVLPYRPALLTNKLLTAIQVLSDNRFLLGIGAGYLAEEFQALGVPIKKRGQITNDTLSLLNESSKNALVESNGQEFLLEPKLTKPPIYIGQNAEIAFERTIKYGDGWMPVSQTPEELKPKIETFQSMAVDAGRGRLEVVAMKTLPLENHSQASEMFEAYKDVGVSQLVHTQGYDSLQQYAEVVNQVESLRI